MKLARSIDKVVGIGYTDPSPIVTKFLTVMPHIPLSTNLVLVCGADVRFFLRNFFTIFFSQLIFAIYQKRLGISEIQSQVRIPRTPFSVE